MPREIPQYTLDGIRDANISTHYFGTADGLGLSMLRFTRRTDGDAVLVIHGLTTSTDMFIMPEHRNLVTCLLDEGFDVWCLDFRMSNRHHHNLTYHRYTLDDCALFDFPPAVEVVRSHIGQRPLHVIAHCLGSASFTMSLFGRAVTGITSLVANSVALTPRIPRWSRMKLSVAPRIVELAGMQYVNPRWNEDPWLTPGKVFSRTLSAFHRECDEPSCHMLSFMWGTGWPALYNHENLDERTHRRAGDLYGPTSMHYYRHMMKMVRAGNTAVKYQPGNPAHTALPDNYFEHARDIDTPVLFMTGTDNRVFTDSNVECHRRLVELGCTQHELKEFPGYGHQDVFMGKDVARDIFPAPDRFHQEAGRWIPRRTQPGSRVRARRTTDRAPAGPAGGGRGAARQPKGRAGRREAMTVPAWSRPRTRGPGRSRRDRLRYVLCDGGDWTVERLAP